MTVVSWPKTKFVGKDPKDTTTNDVIYQKDAVVSTCDEPVPHFGLRATKMKIVSNKWLVMGPANLQIAGVPTPVWLPFAAFPLKKGARKGIIFPSNYTSDPIRGFGLLGVGYYLPINQHWDATLKADLFLRGSFGVELDSRYSYIYKNRGNVRISYKVLREEVIENRNKLRNQNTPTFSLYWTHANERGSNPYQTFSGSLNITTNGDRRRYNNDVRNVSQNQFGSGIQYARSFPELPNLRMSAALAHNQNTQTRIIDITLPDLMLNVSSYPIFKNKKSIAEERWYERINFGMNVNAKNALSGVDSTFFTKKTLNSASVGLKYDANMSTNLKLMKYIDINPSITFTNLHYLRTIEKTFDPTIKYDSLRRIGIFNGITSKFDSTYRVLQYGKVNSQSRWDKLYSLPTFNASVTASTNLFGIIRLKSGKNKVAIRHKVSPSVTYGITPSTYQSAWFRYVQRTNDPQFIKFEQLNEQYSIFEGSAYGAPGFVEPKYRRGNQQLSYSLTQLFETKYRFRKDTIDKKGQLFENIFINGSWNPGADSLKFSDLGWSTNRTFFKGHSTLSITGSMSFYAIAQNEKGDYVTRNTFYGASQRKAGNKLWYLKPLRHQNVNVSFNSQISVKEIRALFEPKTKTVPIDNSVSSGRKNSKPSVTEAPKTPEKKIEIDKSILDLIDNFSISHNFSFAYGKQSLNNKDTLVIGNHSIDLRGNLQLTKHWAVSIGNIGYNFTQKALSYPDFSIRRDLHCWDMSFGYQPQRGSYNFEIRVRQNPLDFLKVPFNKQSPDAFRGF